METGGLQSWVPEGEEEGKDPRIFEENFSKKVVFSISSGKNKISPLLAPPGKIL